MRPPPTRLPVLLFLYQWQVDKVEWLNRSAKIIHLVGFWHQPVGAGRCLVVYSDVKCRDISNLLLGKAVGYENGALLTR